MTKQKQEDYTYSENSDQATLWQFKMIINSGDLRYLLILDSYDKLPEYDTEPLTAAWFEIYAEFSEAVGGNRADLWLIKQKRLLSLRLKYEIDSTALRMVEQLPVQQTIEVAKDCGYEIDLSNFKETFDKARSQLNRLDTKIRIIEAETKHEEKREDLDPLIVTLERHMGFQFKEHEMTVRKFANIYKEYKNVKDRV